MNPLARERRSRNTRPQPSPATNHQPLTTTLDPAPPAMKRLAILLPLLALVVAAGLWATFKSYKDYYAHVRPPVTGGTGENDRAAFLAAYSHSEPERVFLEGEECVLHFGHVPDRWSTRIVLPSGPPAYVFDRFGRLKKWFPDTGEGGFEAWYRTAARNPAAEDSHAEPAEGAKDPAP